MSNPPKSSRSEKQPVRTIDLKPGHGEMLKPAELIDVIGATGLTKTARLAYNQLLHHAFGPDMGEEGHEFQIPLSTLRGSHKGNERIEEAIVQLMRTVVSVRLKNGDTRRVQLLGGNDMGEAGRPHGMLTYSFDKRLIPILKESTVYGRLELEVLHAFTTKYAIALYEAVAKRVRLNYKFMEEFTLAEFRELMGVEDGKLDKFFNFKNRALEPAVMEINALSSYNVTCVPKKTGNRVTHINMGWSLKNVEEMKSAFEELQKHSAGRKARMRGDVEDISEVQVLDDA